MDENSIDYKRRLNREKVQRWRANQSLKIGQKTEKSRKENETEEPAAQRLHTLSQRLSVLSKLPLAEDKLTHTSKVPEERMAELASIRLTAQALSQKMRMSHALNLIHSTVLSEETHGCEAPVEIRLAAQALSQKMRISQALKADPTLFEKINGCKGQEFIRHAVKALPQKINVTKKMIVLKVPKQVREPTPAFIQNMTVSQEIIVTDIPKQAQVPEKAKVSKKIKVKRPARSLPQKKKVSNTAVLAEVKLAAQALSQKMRVSQTIITEKKLTLEAVSQSKAGYSVQDQSKQPAPALSKRSRKMSQKTDPTICDSKINFSENELYQHICGTMDHIQNLWNELEP